jgi:TolB-like protein/DNA-binding winged helix-turn-helix (wHTH) protein
MLHSTTRLHIGECAIDFTSGQLRKDGISSQLDARLARLLMYLAHRPGEVVSIDELLDQVWEGVVVSPDSVYQAITALRKLLGDDQKNPSYIVTVPRRGYKLIATVSSPETAPSVEPALAATVALADSIAGRSTKFNTSAKIGLLMALAVFAVATVFAYRNLHDAAQSGSTASATTAAPHSIAVLPFLDLTDTMTEEPFADGMVEELINKLTKTPGLPVTPAADSFFYKDKQVATEEVARALHVGYVLEGSVRKSGTTLRVTVRLTNAANHFVVWSETYDRPWRDKLALQDEIASEVSRSLAKSLN